METSKSKIYLTFTGVILQELNTVTSSYRLPSLLRMFYISAGSKTGYTLFCFKACFTLGPRDIRLCLVDTRSYYSSSCCILKKLLHFYGAFLFFWVLFFSYWPSSPFIMIKLYHKPGHLMQMTQKVQVLSPWHQDILLTIFTKRFRLVLVFIKWLQFFPTFIQKLHLLQATTFFFVFLLYYKALKTFFALFFQFFVGKLT